MHLAHVYIEHSVMDLDRTFTYRCDGFSLCRGVRVKVPFAHQSLIGFVERVEEVDDDYYEQCSYEIKCIQEVIDEEPLINEELFTIAKTMAKTCAAPMISCFQCMLPSKLKPKSNRNAVKMEAWVIFDHMLDTCTIKQQEVLNSMCERKEMRRTDFYKEYKSVGKKLIELGALRVEKREVEASLFHDVLEGQHFTLSEEQEAAIAAIQAHQDYHTILLHGTTGSGKTEVFLQLADRVMKDGKQVLLLVPEISLTPQMVERVRKRFGPLVAIYHSALNAQEKYEQYMLVKQHKVQIVVGTRSAVFMPFDQLGLIILDEEHDASYKQDVTPRYHCRDIAQLRGNYHHCPVVLASATPSLESYARAYKGVYQLVNMPSRINAQFPQVRVIEMRKAIHQGENYLLSDALLKAIYERLTRQEQVILLLNRRGYTPILRCVSCGYVQMCPHCDIAMSYHKDENLLKCHTCGHTMKLPQSCPTCGKSAWRFLGMGTQRLQEYVQSKFPKARILRMDADTTSRKFAHQEILEQFRKQEADILLGTQMIAKGLDFEKVTLVGVLNGDALLNRTDYRCSEITYDLLEQACGRSGRHALAGEVIIQAYDTKHYAITCAAQHDYLRFFKQEMQYRHLAGYPPYAYLASMVFLHKEEDMAMACAQKAKAQLQGIKEVKILGPSSLLKQKDEYRIRILLKGKDQLYLNELVWMIYKTHLRQKSKVRMEIDLQPLMLD